MLQFIQRHLLAVAVSAVAIVAVGAWVAFGYFGVHTLFIDNEVDEAIPTFTAPERTVPSGPEPTLAPTTTAPRSTDAPSTTVPESTDAAVPTTADETDREPQIMTDAIGMFESIGRYRTVGSAIVLGDGTGQRFLRFEEFETSNGPDLNVYLVNSSADEVSDFVDLGALRGNIGNQNYEIPAEVDLGVYDTVMIWCVRFSSGFGRAMLDLV